MERDGHQCGYCWDSCPVSIPKAGGRDGAHARAGCCVPSILLVLVFTFMPIAEVVVKRPQREAKLILRRCYPPSAAVDAVVAAIKTV